MRMIACPIDIMPIVGGALTDLINENLYYEAGVTIDETVKEIQDMVDFFYGSYLVGMVSTFVGVIPSGWILLDGSVLLQSDYPELTSVVPAAWLSGSDINLPDISDSFVVGAGNLYDLGTEGGETNHVLTVNEIPSHSHTYTPPTVNPDLEGPGVPDVGATVLGPPASTGTAGSGDAHNNVPPFLALNYAIFTGRDYV